MTGEHLETERSDCGKRNLISNGVGLAIARRRQPPSTFAAGGHIDSALLISRKLVGIQMVVVGLAELSTAEGT